MRVFLFFSLLFSLLGGVPFAMASTATGSSGRPVSNENHTSSTLASASKEVHEAIELDKAGKYVEAKAKYTTALCGFLVVLRAETDPARKRALAAKMESYMARAEEIAQFVEGSDDAEGDDGDGDDDDDDDNALDEKAQALIDGLRSSLHNLQREQEKLLKRLNDFEAAPTSVGERTSSKSSNESSNDVASARPAADRSHGSEQPAVHNFYAVSVTTVLLAFSVQCTIAFALLMQMQVAFPGVDARLVFAASMFASLLAICGASALACCCGGGHGSHTVYFGFPFNRQVRASTLGIAKLVSLVLQDESIQSNQERPQAPTAHNDNNGASDDPQETVEEEAPETATTAQPAEADETASNVDHSSTSASTGATAPSTTDEARVTTGPATADTSVEETTAPEADTPPSVQTVDDRLRRFDKTLMLASIAAAADPDATNNPLMLEAASILDGFSDAEEATLQQEEKIALLWRRARCLVKQARSFSKAERVPILSKAHATAQQAYNLAVGARGGVCSDPQVLLWYGISIVEYRLPAGTSRPRGEGGGGARVQNSHTPCAGC